MIRPASDGPHRATLLKAGSDIVFQLHYTPNGKATTDQTKIGLIFAKEPPKERLMGGNSALMRFAIPPDDPNISIDGRVDLCQYDCESGQHDAARASARQSVRVQHHPS